MNTRLALSGLALASIALIGCGGTDGPTLYPVTGTVTKGGNPLGGVTVTFSPESGPSSAGRTDDAGKFVLLSSTGKAGAVAGAHTVTLAVVSDTSTGEMTGADFERMAASRNAAATEGNKGQPEEDATTGGIPADYTNPENTPLKYTVAESGDNDFDIPIP